MKGKDNKKIASDVAMANVPISDIEDLNMALREIESYIADAECMGEVKSLLCNARAILIKIITKA